MVARILKRPELDLCNQVSETVTADSLRTYEVKEDIPTGHQSVWEGYGY